MTQTAPLPALSSQSTFQVTAKLCVMMFLQFFIWGAWYVGTWTYMASKGMSESACGFAYTVFPIAALISPFFLGIIADRFFSSERVLATMHLLGGITMLAAPFAAGVSAEAFLLVLQIHALCYMPTLGLTNSIAFHNITNQEKQFPVIRVFGTAGWIIANLFLSFGFQPPAGTTPQGVADRLQYMYYTAGAAAILLGIFSVFLPHTPPPAKGKKASMREILGLDSLVLFKSRAFLVFAICSFLICIPLAAYYAMAENFVKSTGTQYSLAIMSVGQGAEVIFMLLMPLFFARLGVKWMLAVGMLAWVVRYGLFAAAAPSGNLPLVVAGIALHGICYDFFFVTGFIYTDKRASKQIRGQAQGLLVLITQGLGLGIGAQLMTVIKGKIIGTATGADLNAAYQKFWMFPAIFALVVLVIFILLFKDDSTTNDKAPAAH